MLCDHFIVFQEKLPGGANFYTSPRYMQRLAKYDVLAWYVTVTQLTSGTGTLNVQMEMSGDGEFWTSKRGSPEMSLSIASGSPNVGAYVDSGIAPSLHFVRLRIHLTGTSGRVRIVAALRDVGAHA